MLLPFVIASLVKNPLHNKGKINFQAQPLALFMDITKEHRSHPFSEVNKLNFIHGITVSHNRLFFVFTESNVSHIVAHLHPSIVWNLNGDVKNLIIHECKQSNFFCPCVPLWKILAWELIWMVHHNVSNIWILMQSGRLLYSSNPPSVTHMPGASFFTHWCIKYHLLVYNHF